VLKEKLYRARILEPLEELDVCLVQLSRGKEKVDLPYFKLNTIMPRVLQRGMLVAFMPPLDSAIHLSGADTTFLFNGTTLELSGDAISKLPGKCLLNKATFGS
jgi:hypothetical protein